MIDWVLHAVTGFARRHPQRVFALMAVALVVAGVLSTRLRFDTEILNLLPADDPVVSTFRETLTEFGSLDFLLVLVRVPPGAVVDPYLELVDDLGSRLGALPEMQYVEYRIGEMAELVDEFLPRSFLFLDAAGRKRVEERLGDDQIRQRALELRRRVETPQSLMLQELLLLDPLGISEIFLDQLGGARGVLKVDWSTGYLVSRDRSLILLIGKPVAPAQEVEFGRKLLAAVDEAKAAALSGWSAIAGSDGPPPPEIEIGGSYVTAVEDAEYVFRDVITNGVTSIVGVLLLFFVAFRRLGLVMYALLPLGAGLVLAFGFAAGTIGTLSAATTGFAALLIGLGIDFIIVSYGRYVEERGRGATLDQALERMSGSSGRAVITGGITTAATFYAFMVTEFTGLRQLGFLVGTGILFCMISVLVLLPAMLAWREDHRDGILKRFFVRGERKPVLHIEGFGADRLIALSYRRPVAVLVAGGLLTVVCGWLALRLDFVDSIRAMRPQGNPGVLIQEEIADHFGSGFDYMMLVISGPDEHQVLERAAVAAERARELVGQGVLNGVDSLSALLPSPERQREALGWLAEARSSVLAPGRAEAIFSRSALAAGLRPEAFSRGFELLERAASVTTPVSVESFADSEDRRRLLERYVRKSGDSWRAVVYLQPPPRVWKREAPPEVAALAEELGPNVVLTGVNLVSERLRSLVKGDAVLAAVLGFVLVALLLWADYHRLGDTLLSLAPLLVGIVWMLGGMALAGLHMNFFNVFVTTMIIGIGVDYGVHMMHRYRESGGVLTLEALQETGKAIVLAALSTSVGFGSMSTSRYPGLQSMGIVAIIGALATALVAVTLLPAFLSLRERQRGRDTGS